MSCFASLLAVLAALASSVSAVDCVAGTGSCAPDDLTSLLQVKGDMKFGNERAEIEEAGFPSTRAAFDSNKEKVESKMDAEAANHRAFEREVESARAQSDQEAAKQVREDRLAVVRGTKADQDALATAEGEHRDAEDDAAMRVSAAKKQWEETSAQKHYAEEAALAGRRAGVDAGVENANRVRIEEAKEAAGAAMERQIASEKAFEERRHREKREAVDRQTMKQEAENNAYAGHVAHESHEALDRSSERTADAVNHMKKSEEAMMHASREHVGHYEDSAEQDRGRIEEAVAAQWPDPDAIE